MAPSSSIPGCCSPVVTDPNHTFALHLGAITVEGTGTLDRATVQLYLDDTSNGPDGQGNTIFVRLDRLKHAVPHAATNPLPPNGLQKRLASPQGDGMRTLDPVVVWPMQGSMHNVREGGLPHPMPHVAKVVVTGETRAEVGGVEKFVHGVLGGALFSLGDLVDALASKGGEGREGNCFRVPIYNGFMDRTTKGPDGQGEVDTRLVTVAFHAVGPSTTTPPPAPISDAVDATPTAMMSAVPRSAKEQQMEYQQKRSTIFKASSLPTEHQSRVLREFLPPAINTLWLERIDQGLYPMPANAPANFADLNLQDRCKVLDSEPGKAMFRAGGTPNARIAGQVYPHIVAALPGMNNEMEQPAITNGRLLVHAYHAALTMFKGYGWDAGTLFRKVAQGELDEELTSFLGFVLSSVLTLPSTQEYVSDVWLFKDPFSPLSKPWRPTIGEDWQVANASMASWNFGKAWGPSGHDDCESKAHHLAALYLRFVALVGGKGNQWIQARDGKGMEGVRANVMREALQMPVAAFGKGVGGGGATAAAGEVHLQPIGAEAMHSILAFAESRHELFKAGKLGSDEAIMADSITLLAALFASDSFQLDMILGEAFGAAATSTRTRKPGGHAYAISTFCGQTALLEGTGSVLNRMHAEHAEHARSVMRFEAGLSMVMEAAWNTGTAMGEYVIFVKGGSAPLPVQASFRPMMLCSSVEHTENFYGKALVASRVKTFREIVEDPTRAHGAYLFTKDTEVAGRMEFGVQPEDPLHHSAVYAEVRGLMVDQAIAGSRTFQAQVRAVQAGAVGASGGDGCGGVADDGRMATHPFTTSIAASVSSVREIGGQRIPFSHWARWMGRMYGEGVPELRGCTDDYAMAKGCEGFDNAGRVARVIVTFQSREELREASQRVRSCWMRLQTPELLLQGLAEVQRTSVLPDAVKASLVHAQRVVEEIVQGSVGGAAAAAGMPRLSFAAHETLNTIVLTCRVNTACGIRREVFTEKAGAKGA